MSDLKTLFNSLNQRKRPEDIAEIISDLLGNDLSVKERLTLEKATKGALKKSFFGYSSMSDQFRSPVGAYAQISKAAELFEVEGLSADQADKPESIVQFIEDISPLLQKEMGKNNFLGDRLNRKERELENLDISKRQYNKRWRLLKRLEKKLKVGQFLEK